MSPKHENNSYGFFGKATTAAEHVAYLRLPANQSAFLCWSQVYNSLKFRAAVVRVLQFNHNNMPDARYFRPTLKIFDFRPYSY
jgi:hypothetical protein